MINITLWAIAAFEDQPNCCHKPHAITRGAIPIITTRNKPGRMKLLMGNPSSRLDGNPIPVPLGSINMLIPPPNPPSDSRMSKMMRRLSDSDLCLFLVFISHPESFSGTQVYFNSSAID